MSSPSDIIAERKAMHGSWYSQAECAYRLKAAAELYGKNWEGLAPSQREALSMILVKVSRILTGDASAPDHWDDIAGYALLGKGGHDA